MNGIIKTTSEITVKDRRGVVSVVIFLSRDTKKENIMLSSSMLKRTDKTLRLKEKRTKEYYDYHNHIVSCENP